MFLGRLGDLSSSHMDIVSKMAGVWKDCTCNS